MKEIKITYQDGVSHRLPNLRFADVLKFAGDVTKSDDLELKFSLFGSNDAVLMEVTSYEDDFYNSYIIFDNNDVK